MISSRDNLGLRTWTVSWDRGVRSAPDGCRPANGAVPGSAVEVLHTAGFIANRRDLCRLVGEDYATPDELLLIHLYETVGLSAAEQIAGPFSFVLWDARASRVVAAADRSGEQRLYVARSGARLRLANAVEALVGEHPAVADLDEISISGFLSYFPIPAQRTFFRDVVGIVPGEQLVASAEGERMERFWRPESTPRLELANDAEYAEACWELLRDVVSEYAPDGPAALTVSGGLDSTSVAAAVRRARPDERLTAIRWISPDVPEANESRDSEAVARFLKMDDVAIDAGRLWPLSADTGIETFLASPFTNLFREMTDALFTAAVRHGDGYLFTGIGGDHLFGGMIFSYADLLLGGRLRTLLGDLRSHRSRSRFATPRLLGRFVLRPLVEPLLDRVRRIATPPVPWLDDRRRPVFRDFQHSLPRPPVVMRPFRRARFLLATSAHLTCVNEWSGRRARTMGARLRNPLLDHRLVEFALSLPAEQVSRADRDKMILRRALTGRLPAEILDKTTRTGTTAIALRGLREREAEKVRSLLTDMRSAELGFVDERAARSEYERFAAGATDKMLFWDTLTLEAWLRTHF